MKWNKACNSCKWINKRILKTKQAAINIDPRTLRCRHPQWSNYQQLVSFSADVVSYLPESKERNKLQTMVARLVQATEQRKNALSNIPRGAKQCWAECRRRWIMVQALPYCLCKTVEFVVIGAPPQRFSLKRLPSERRAATIKLSRNEYPHYEGNCKQTTPIRKA